LLCLNVRLWLTGRRYQRDKLFNRKSSHVLTVEDGHLQQSLCATFW